jgi:hypothetical protein
MENDKIQIRFKLGVKEYAFTWDNAFECGPEDIMDTFLNFLEYEYGEDVVRNYILVSAEELK